jgi:hypothetical protein
MLLNRNTFKKFSAVLLSWVSGFSVFYFLYFFGAYGIQQGMSYSGHSHLFRSISFGVLTFTYLLVFESWVKPKLKIKGIKRSMLWYMALVLLGNQLIFLLFNFFWNWQEWNIEAWALIQKEFPLIMIFPLFFYLSIMAVLKQKVQEVDYLLFQSDNGKDRLKIKLKDFLYASSSENYVSITYISGHQNRQHLIRKTLKNLEGELKTHPEIVRIHRSYLVNRAHVQNIKQTKGKVFIEIGTASLPVSKNYQNDFLN